MYTGAQWAKKLGFIKGTALNRNTGMLVVLSSFAFGQFFMASTTGKELVHLLHPVFQAGSFGDSSSPNHQNNSNRHEPSGSVDPERLREMRAARRKSLMETLHHQRGGISDSHSGHWVEEASSLTEENGNHTESPTPVDPQRLRDMRLARRKSLMEQLYSQKGGISDSHSGRWVQENSETKFEKEY